MRGPYDDIIDLPHHTSTTHAKMAPIDRAAQFSPFAALTGHAAAIHETARLTDRWVELDEDVKVNIDMKLRLIADRLDEPPEVRITYFRPDDRKSGGEYISITGTVRKIVEHEHTLVMADGTRIPIDFIAKIESNLFSALE